MSALLDHTNEELRDLMNKIAKILESRPELFYMEVASCSRAPAASPHAPTPVQNFQQASTTTPNSKKRRVTALSLTDPIDKSPVPTSNRFDALSDTTPEQTDTTPAIDEDPASSKPQSVPPFVLRDKQSWTKVSKHFKDQNTHYSKATNGKDCITIFTANEAQYRQMYKTLSTLQTPFHTFQLRSEKSLRVVLRGVPQDITSAEVAADLETQNYPALRVTRLNGRNNHPAPLVMVELDKQYKSIYNLEQCCGLNVTVESKKTSAGQRQCHKCQLYGHTQPNCHASYKCMRCAGDHSTHECTKLKTLSAKCANCLGEHTSIYSQCPSNPNKNLFASRTAVQVQTRQQTLSYSSAVRGASPPQDRPAARQAQSATAPTPTPTNRDAAFSKTLGDMLITLYATNPTPQLVIEFVNQTRTLYNIYSSK